MKRTFKDLDDVAAALGEQTADEMMELAERFRRHSSECFSHYTCVDAANVASVLCSLMREKRGAVKVDTLLHALRSMPTWDDAEAFRRGELTVRLGGLDEGATFERFVWALVGLLTRGEALPQWASELLQEGNKIIRSSGDRMAGMSDRRAPLVIVQAGGSFFDVHDNTNIAF